MSRQILVLDLGTTYFKSCLFDDQCTLVAMDRVAPPLDHPAPDRCELDATAFRETLRHSIGRVARQCPNGLAEVQAVCFSTQTNSYLLLDQHNQPLTPLLLWPDARATELSEQVAALASPSELISIAGRPSLGPQVVPAKLLWMRQHQPDIWRRSRRLCLISDYLTLWLSGQHVTEIGAMAFTGLVDIRSCAWWPQMLERLEVPVAWLPKMERAGTDLGAILPSVAAELGLPTTCRVMVGAFDQHAGAVGVGNLHPGGASETTGTVLVSLRCTDHLETAPRGTIYQGPTHSPGLYYQLAVSETSANLLEWYRNQLPDRPEFAELDRLAAAVPSGSAGLRLIPNSHPQQGSQLFANFGIEHTRGHAVRCIMEAVADELAAQVHLLWGDDKPAVIHAAGGGARSALWLQIKANVLGIPLVATSCPEPTSRGAAFLTACSLGWAEPLKGTQTSKDGMLVVGRAG